MAADIRKGWGVRREVLCAKNVLQLLVKSSALPVIVKKSCKQIHFQLLFTHTDVNRLHSMHPSVINVYLILCEFNVELLQYCLIPECLPVRLLYSFPLQHVICCCSLKLSFIHSSSISTLSWLGSRWIREHTLNGKQYTANSQKLYLQTQTSYFCQMLKKRQKKVLKFAVKLHHLFFISSKYVNK